MASLVRFVVAALVAGSLGACEEPFSARVGPPAALRHASGNGQRDTVGAVLAESIAVRVVDAAGQPVPGVTVIWGHGATSGSIEPPTSITSDDGVARARWRLGLVPGGQVATATVDGVAPLTFSAVALAIVRAGPLGWTLVHQGLPRPRSSVIGIAGGNPSDVFTATQDGQVYWYDGFGWSELISHGAPGTLEAMWGPASVALYAVGLTATADTAFVASFVGQHWTTPYRAPGERLRAVHGTSASDLWAVGSQIVHYDGAAWTTRPSPVADARAVWAASPGVAFVGDEGGAVHMVDSVATPLGSARGTPIRVLFGYAPDDLYAGDAAGAVLHWNGAQWSTVAQIGSQPIVAMWGPAPGELWVVGSAYAHLRGGSWTVLDDDDALATNVIGVWGSSAQDVWAVTDSLRLKQFDGAGWREHWDSPVPFEGIWGTSASDLHVCGGQGTVQRFDGNHWATDRLAGWQACRSMDGPSATLAVASTGGAFAYLFDGSDWVRTSTGVGMAGGIWVDASGIAMAAGPPGTVLRFDGATWTPLATGSTAQVHTVWGNAPDDVWAAGTGGTLLHYDGSAWTPAASGVTSTIHRLWGNDAANIYAVAEGPSSGGLILRYDGAQWGVEHSTDMPLRAIHGRTADDVFAAGDGGTIVRWDGTAWQAESSGFGEGLVDIWASPEGDVFAVGARGAIVRGRR
jgi:hypothetical protein